MRTRKSRGETVLASGGAALSRTLGVGISSTTPTPRSRDLSGRRAGKGRAHDASLRASPPRKTIVDEVEVSHPDPRDASISMELK